MEQFALDLLIRGNSADGGDGAAALAAFATPDGVGTITSIEQLILMPLKKSLGMFLIPDH